MREQLQQVIYANDDVYSFLISYFQDQISDFQFQQDLRCETKRNNDERWNLSQHMAAWLLYDRNYKVILWKIYELMGIDMG